MNTFRYFDAIMAAFDEQVLREYFEAHGVFVRAERRRPASRRKGTEETLDFHIFNPQAAADPAGFVWFSSDLRAVREARVFIRPWHRETGFSARMLAGRPAELAKFLQSKVVRVLGDVLEGTGKDVPRVLVLPAFPTAEPQRTECARELRSGGVDAVLSFRSILDDVLQRVDLGQAYTKTGFMETLRVLKSYDLLREPQLGLFKG